MNGQTAQLIKKIATIMGVRNIVAIIKSSPVQAAKLKGVSLKHAYEVSINNIRRQLAKDWDNTPTPGKFKKRQDWMRFLLDNKEELHLACRMSKEGVSE